MYTISCIITLFCIIVNIHMVVYHACLRQWFGVYVHFVSALVCLILLGVQ